MAQVTELKINFQQGSNNTYYATWKWATPEVSTSSGSIQKGSLVTIKSGATWYNGVEISSWVFGQKWFVDQVKGDRAVLGKNMSGSNNVNSPINVKYLTLASRAVTASSRTVSTRAATDDSTFDHFEVEWFYDTGDGVWFSGGSSTTTLENSVYSAQDNAVAIRVDVKPVSKTRTVNDKETPYWSGTKVSTKYYMLQSPPAVPQAPMVEVDGLTLTASLENISDGRADQIQFDLFKGNTRIFIGIATVQTRRASFKFSITPGADYRVRCAAINTYLVSKLYSDWSEYSDPVGTIPSTPSSIKSARAGSSTSVILTWNSIANADSYDIEYATQRDYLTGSNASTTVSGIETTRYEITGLESGNEYFFRLRAVNDEGESGWSAIKSAVIGKPPAAPTTWSSTTTAIVGEPLVLYWVHNSEDGSKQKKAEVEVYYNDVKQVYTVTNPDFDNEEEEDRTSQYTIDTTSYSEGTTIKWRVRTCGVTDEYGDWSTQRTVDVYAPVVAELILTDSSGAQLDILTEFPFHIACNAYPTTQTPIGYHVSILANSTYETVNNVGNTVTINAGDEIYSKYFDISEPLSVDISAGDVSLENNQTYTVVCVASMDSGLTGESSLSFEVSWTDVAYDVDAAITIDEDSYSAYISPICRNDPENDVSLSIYRREFDGRFTEIATGIQNNSNTWILDPHPSLDYARYRIVGRSQTTGSISFYDVPGEPVNCNSIIIQWDDEWSDFNVTEGAEMEIQPWTGSMIKIPYNIDVSDSNSPDVALVEYIGRQHPVSYYGTQLGSSSTWSVEIPKSDEDLIYALRRLQTWMGDVYVREPSGTGYWANLTVSFSLNHTQVTVPVTFNIKRVEGGI